MDEFGLVWLSLVWFDEVDFLKCSRSASQLSFTNLLLLCKGWRRGSAGLQGGHGGGAALQCEVVPRRKGILQIFARRPA